MEFRLLGPVEAYRDDQPVDLGRRQERCLLGLLLLEPGRAISAERLLDLLWGEDVGPNARKTLHTYVARLRASLGAIGVGLESPAAGFYMMRVAPELVDLHRFSALVARSRDESDPGRRAELLHQALGLWRGEFMAGVATDVVRRRIGGAFEEQRLIAQELHLEAEIANGGHDEVLPTLTELVHKHPVRERFCELYMLALYRCGRKTDALGAYHRLRDHLVDDYGLEPGQGLRLLQQRILQSDPTLGVPLSVGAGTGRRFLPRDTPSFAGRVRELDELSRLADEEAASAGAVLVTAVTGTAGVGKTALALRWAYRSMSRFPGGQLYIDLQGYGQGRALTSVEALGHLLRMLGVVDQAPFNEEGAAAAYRAAIADRRILILLDNASTAEQVRPLLPSCPGSLVLITSRDRLSGLVARDGARRLILDVLTAQDAVDLLAQVLGLRRVAADRLGAAELATACGHLPLAIRIAAAHLADEPDRGLGEYAQMLASGDRLAELAVAGDPRSSLQVIFEDSFRSLSPLAQRAFCLLGILEGPDFTPESTAALLELDLSEAATILDRLVSANLIAEHLPERFTMHDLLRDFARYLVGVGSYDEVAAIGRLTMWCLERADAAARLLDPKMIRMRSAPPSEGTFADHKAAGNWLERERANLVGIVRQAASFSLAAACLLTDALRPYLVFRAPLDLLTITESALPTADRSDDLRAKVAVRISRAHALAMIERPDEALEVAEEAASLCERSDWVEGRVAVLGMLGMTHFEVGNLPAAMLYGEQALELAVARDDIHGQAIALGRLALVSLLRGQLSTAEAYLERTLVEHERAGQGVEHAVALINLSDVNRLMGNLSRAERHVSEAMARAKELGHQFIEALARAGLAATLRARGDNAQAQVEAEKAHAALTDSGVPQGIINAKQILAIIHVTNGDTSSAERLIREALPLAEGLGIKYVVVEIWLAYADLLRRLGDLEPAQDYTQRAIQTAGASDYAVLLGQGRTILAEICLEKGAWDEAENQANHALTIQSRTGHRPGYDRAGEALAAVRAARVPPAG